MNTEDQIVDKDAEKESGEYALKVADNYQVNPDYEKFDGKISEEELKALLEEVKLTPPDVAVEEVAEEKQPVLTPEQQKAMRVKAAGMIFKGGMMKPGTNKIGVTRANKKLSKKAEKTAKKSRKISRGKS
jgi:hypothetical protein